MLNEDDAKRIVDEENGKSPFGKKLTVSMSTEYKKAHGLPTESQENQSNRKNNLKNSSDRDSACVLFVYGVSKKAKDEDLKQFFSSRYKVVDCRIVNTNNNSGEDSKRYAFVTYEKPEYASEMVEEFNGREFFGNNLKVSIKEKNNRSNHNREDRMGGDRGRYNNYNDSGMGYRRVYNRGPNQINYNPYGNQQNMGIPPQNSNNPYGTPLPPPPYYNTSSQMVPNDVHNMMNQSQNGYGGVGGGYGRQPYMPIPGDRGGNGGGGGGGNGGGNGVGGSQMIPPYGMSKVPLQQGQGGQSNNQQMNGYNGYPSQNNGNIPLPYMTGTSNVQGMGNGAPPPPPAPSVPSSAPPPSQGYGFPPPLPQGYGTPIYGAPPPSIPGQAQQMDYVQQNGYNQGYPQYYNSYDPNMMYAPDGSYIPAPTAAPPPNGNNNNNNIPNPGIPPSGAPGNGAGQVPAPIQSSPQSSSQGGGAGMPPQTQGNNNPNGGGVQGGTGNVGYYSMYPGGGYPPPPAQNVNNQQNFNNPATPSNPPKQ